MKWYIVLTQEAVRDIIPSYMAEGSAPYLVLDLGDKGAMVWPMEVVSDIMRGYISTYEQLQILKEEYENKISMDNSRSGADDSVHSEGE